jgi:hypothetical protein
VAFGFHAVPDCCYLSIRADEKCASHDTHECTAHEFLFLPGAELFDGLVIWIAQQWKIEPILPFERSLRGDGIGAHAQDDHTKLIEFLLCVTKLGRFDRSTRSVCLGIEIKQNALALKIIERHFLIFVRLEKEIRGFVADFQHGFTPNEKLGE